MKKCPCTTPPWKVEIHSNQYGLICRIVGNLEEYRPGAFIGDDIATIVTEYKWPNSRKMSEEEWKFNAKLLSEAPKMYEIIKNFMSGKGLSSKEIRGISVASLRLIERIECDEIKEINPDDSNIFHI